MGGDALGDLLGARIGPYRVLSELGAGGMGTVYLAEADSDAETCAGRNVALKIVHPHLLSDAGLFDRFRREAEIGLQIQHDNVVRTLDAGNTVLNGVTAHYLVMEFVEGQTLRGLLDELDTVPEELCRHIGREIALALIAIHDAGAVHRDLKPENVLITPDHGIKVMDLGLVALQDQAVKLSQTGQFIGSLLYASPEQFMGGSKVDGRADLYALGLMLYELATGHHPFRDDDINVVIMQQLQGEARRPGEINPQLSPFCEELVLQLIAKERDDRPSSAHALFEILVAGEKAPWWEQRSAAIRDATDRPLRRIRIPRETALYGRESAISKLRSLYSSAKSGAGRALLLEGEAGVGKTRLIVEYAGMLEAEGEDINFLFGSYPPGGAATAGGAFAAAFRAHLGTKDLERRLEEQYLSAVPLLVPAFAAFLRGEPAPQGSEPLTKAMLQTVLTHLVRGLAAERPTILVIDDLHFAPDEGRGLFAALTQAAPEHSLLLVGTSRRGVSREWGAELDREDHVTRLPVERLNEAEIGQLLEDALGSARMAEELTPKVVLKSDGNPFFVFEILRGLREGQFLTQKIDGSWVSTSLVREIEIPSSVGDLISVRVSGLDDEDRDILNVAACCGYEFDPILVGEALGLRRIAALKRLAHLEDRLRLVRSAGDRFVFDHHQIQEQLYAALPPLLAKEYHAALGEALEELSEAEDYEVDELSELEGETLAALCEHLVKGGRGKRGKRYLDAALQHYETGHANQAAVTLMDRALEARKGKLLKGEERIALLLRKGRRLDFLGLREDERSTLQEALELADDSSAPDQQASVRRDYGWFLSRMADYDSARERLEEALQFARAADDRMLEANALSNLGVVHQNQGSFEDARECWEKQVEIQRELGYRLGEARGTGNLAILWALQGRMDKAYDYTKRKLELSRELNERRGEAIALTNLGNVFLNVGKYDKARDHAQQAISIARKIGDRWTEAAATAILGMVLLDLGEFPDAQENLERYLGLARECGYQSAVGEGLIALGRLEVQRGRSDAAARLFDQAMELAEKVKVPQTEVVAAAYRALLPGGDTTRALDALSAHESKVGCHERIEARFALWKRTRDKDHLEKAHRLLLELRENAPRDYRTTLMEKVPLHHEIVEAWEDEAQA